MVELRRLLLDKGLLFDCAVLVYIDDWILLAATEELVLRNMQSFNSVLTSLGLKIHPTKKEGPLQAIGFIGFLLDLATPCLSITDDKRLKIVAHLKELITQVEAGK